MAFAKYQKDTSERSDAVNWVKKELLKSTVFHFDSIEGCNQNDKNTVTHLFDRAQVFFNEGSNEIDSPEVVFNNILRLEPNGALERKLNLAKKFGAEYQYILYCMDPEMVLRYSFTESGCYLEAKYNSFKDFSDWIQSIKVWKSSKIFREEKELPEFDKALRAAGCAWPTNIDCFISTNDNQPFAFLEFQNAKNTHVRNHNSNSFFLHNKEIEKDKFKAEDMRRWLSQEILRVQSQLRLLVITWSQKENFAILREVRRVCFPHYTCLDPSTGNRVNCRQKYSKLLFLYRKFRESNDRIKAKKYYDIITADMSSYILINSKGIMNEYVFNPPLDHREGTFPLIYFFKIGGVDLKKDQALSDFEKEVFSDK